MCVCVCACVCVTGVKVWVQVIFQGHQPFVLRYILNQMDYIGSKTWCYFVTLCYCYCCYLHVVNNVPRKQ